MLRLAVAAFLLVAGAVPAAAQQGPVTVRSTVDRSSMAIGDQILLTITVDLAPGYDLLDPGVPRAVGDFEVVDTLTALQTRSSSGSTRIQLRYLVTAFDLGPKRLPVIVVGYRGPDGRPGEAQSDTEHLIQVLSVVLPGEDTSDIKPLKPPLAVPGSTLEALQRWVPAVALAIALVGAVILALRLRRRRPLAGMEPAPGPARRALDDLERIFERRLPEQGKTREHYELVSATLRRYATERFGVRAEARTARELRRDLEQSGVDRTQAQILFDALHDAEAVRYEEQVVYPARAQKTMRDLLDVMRRSVVAEEYELIESGATA